MIGCVPMIWLQRVKEKIMDKVEKKNCFATVHKLTIIHINDYLYIHSPRTEDNKTSVNIEIQTHCQKNSFLKETKTNNCWTMSNTMDHIEKKQWMNAGAPIEWSVHIVHVTSPWYSLVNSQWVYACIDIDISNMWLLMSNTCLLKWYGFLRKLS